MIVAKSQRGKGIATAVIQSLLIKANAKGLIAICSTEKVNIAAQKAISRAGLNTQDRIIQFEFDR